MSDIEAETDVANSANEDIDQEGMDSLEPHPLSNLVPEMAPDEFLALREDIKANGLLEPIVVFEGLILDGRHRHRAFTELRGDGENLKWTPDDFINFDGSETDASLKVMENVQRRHLTKPGLAVVACTLYLDDARREAEARKKSGSQTDNSDAKGEAYDVAAAKVSGVSGRSIREIDAIRVDPNLNDVWTDLLKGRFRFISEAVHLTEYTPKERGIIRRSWESQGDHEKDWKRAFRAIAKDPKPDPKEKARKRMKRLRAAFKQVHKAFDELQELPSFKGKTDQKKAEYRNFLEGVLADLEEIGEASKGTKEEQAS